MAANSFFLLSLFFFISCDGVVQGQQQIVGTWFVNINGAATLQTSLDRAVLTISEIDGQYSGNITDMGETDLVSDITYDASSSLFQFCRHGPGNSFQWFSMNVVNGVARGRLAVLDSPSPPASYLDYQLLASAWQDEAFSALVPRSYHLMLNGSQQYARLDLDMNGTELIGRFKIYHSVVPDAPYNGEQLEYDIVARNWDGTLLSWSVVPVDQSWMQTFVCTVSGRELSGTYVDTRLAPGVFDVTGVRWALLAYGLTSRPAASRLAYQQATRATLEHLLMAGNPIPMAPVISMTQLKVSGSNLGDHRDDHPSAWPQSYDIFEMNLTYTLVSPYNASNLHLRTLHGYLSVPSDLEADEKVPACLFLNGHMGSSYQMMYTPNGTIYWYGDAVTRRLRHITFALDISHRNESIFYHDNENNGDDPTHGNGPHPAISFPGFNYSDWVEDGERGWDGLRAADFLFSHPNVDTTKVSLTGLSMGGSITTIVGALDTRFSVLIPAGLVQYRQKFRPQALENLIPKRSKFVKCYLAVQDERASPDFDVIIYNGNHPCYLWEHSNIREFVDDSTYHALMAPRPLIVLTGKQDYTYSQFEPPFASDKQVLRRTRAAYGEQAELVFHYLHYDYHRWHAGDVDEVDEGAEMYVRLPLIIEPVGYLDQTWQTDNSTAPAYSMNYTLFDWLVWFYALPSLT